MSSADGQGVPGGVAAAGQRVPDRVVAPVIIVSLGKILNIFFLLVSFPALLLNLFVDYSY
jgi:hypothetical protein